MFSSALKSFSSNIASNYSIASNPTSVSSPWKIYDATKKSTGRAASVFVFDRKILEPQAGGFGGRGGAAAIKRAQDEVIERLKKEASSLARLRHPSILELAEPVEETRSGGLMFATEPVTASLGGLLRGKDGQEKAGGIGGRTSRYVIEDAEGGRRRREVEIDELEIQKGLLQVAKGLEFLHESAGLVHANLTPEAIFVNAKSDWKISGLGFSSPADSNSTNTAVTPIALSEVLNYDTRLPRLVQLNLDYASPDLVLDSNMNTSADMFSLGLVVIALYNSPHRSPLETNSSISTYKRIFNSSSTVPTRNNNFLASQPLPNDITSDLLPRLITRRPAQRMNSKEFQQAKYFDNILVSTIRFLDSLAAKSHNEKAQFMRGAPGILPQFPKSVLEKKVLPVLLDELKNRELLSAVLQNIFKVVSLLPGSKRAFPEKVLPKFREVFLQSTAAKGHAQERDLSRESGIAVLLENISLVTENCSGKEFKDDILPIVYLGLESPTASVVDSSLQKLPIILPVLDFTTVKNELFPVVATVFSKTSSMSIKIRGLKALNVLCGGSSEAENEAGDPFDGNKPGAKSSRSSSVLDKYTMQEKVVPLLRGIKTKEPAVMMAALDVFKQVGQVADTEFLATDVLPCLWHFSLGSLLNVKQFQAFMTQIKSLSNRIETEQMRKLQDLSAGSMSNGRPTSPLSFTGTTGDGLGASSGVSEDDFESLVTGRKSGGGSNDMMDSGWGDVVTSRPLANRSKPSQQQTPSFSWSTSNTSSTNQNSTSNFAHPGGRTVTPDITLRSIPTLAPTPSTPPSASPGSFSQPLQPQRTNSTMSSLQPQSTSTSQSSKAIDWTSSMPSNPWSSNDALASVGPALPQQQGTSSFNIPPPRLSNPSWTSQPSNGWNSNSTTTGSQSQKQGLDKYESLI